MKLKAFINKPYIIENLKAVKGTNEILNLYGY
jgi:hypothetical protein